MDEPPVLELRGITKEFPGVLANDHVDFDLRRSEVHALLGENGAGKSTLMSILYGLYTPDSGEILMNGKPVTINSPKDAIELGIGMVHQHCMPVCSSTTTQRPTEFGSSPRRSASPWIRTRASRRSPSASSSEWKS